MPNICGYSVLRWCLNMYNVFIFSIQLTRKFDIQYATLYSPKADSRYRYSVLNSVFTDAKFEIFSIQLSIQSDVMQGIQYSIQYSLNTSCM